MSTSRKRYRPLDSAEERAVTVHERLQLLPLENEQSYCFSWPEAPLTQWLQDDVPYASLYQLYANTGGGVGGGGVSSHAMRNQSSGLGDADVASAALGLPKGTSSKLVASSSAGRRDALGLRSPTGTISFSAPHHPRSIEVPPVFTLDDFEPASALHAPPLKASGGEGVASSAPYGGAGVQRLLHRVRDAMRHESIATASIVKSEVLGAKDGASPSTVPSPSIVVQSDAAERAVPHPLAPPRPQSITEDSIFSLSATQLADLVAAGVPALHASAARADTQGSSQRAQAPHTSVATSAKGLPSGEAGTAPTHTRCACSGHDRQRGAELAESARREIEHEVVGLEWRTWSQSQRTAAALQRILSLKAAVPFESSGDARRDAWRATVYGLWLQWRQQQLPPTPERTSAGGSAASSTRADTLGHGFSGASAVPSVSNSSCGLAASVSPSPAASALAFPKGALVPSHHQPHLPWGAPLLAGAYLYCTSNDYFISLPPSTTSATGSVGKGGGSNSGGSPMNATTTASLWPAMSRRRGTYSFLRWKVELYEAQLSRTTAAADEENDGDGDEVVERDKAKGVDVRDRGGNGSATAAKVRRYSKGPLGGTETDAPASMHRPRRGEDDHDGYATAISRSTGRKAATATVVSSAGHAAINGVMSVAHMKALLHATVLTQPLTELEMDDEPTTVMERLACTDLRRDTDAWRVWLSRV
ncbi:conserved hypothetical protein [Leishmania major strain Friedlin]|uniref:Uncharacterized protein n=1 Tax=Leishmania major TaxID=5664 RepID=Q4QBQ9_LEIMA|nr:conserved hypothetical protein [Leishmania major strain Friedlin]CAG9573954.1 hypothetical_protein_-_conserved [Leishmania major strain Friedlin]CAJ04352.1 conserved hypothetical protein [Leishmania major strain Friedlin]|eukprot:XP_001683239.1 conserved hypothetical protein [Leishmania major strain Friedlin]